MASPITEWLATRAQQDAGAGPPEPWESVQGQLNQQFDTTGVSPELMRGFYENARSRAVATSRIGAYQQQAQAPGNVNPATVMGYMQSVNPFMGELSSVVETQRNSEASQRVESGQATEEDYQRLGYSLAHRQRQQNRGVLGSILDTAVAIPAFGVEFAAGAPAYNAVAAPVAARLGGGLLARGAGAAVGTGAFLGTQPGLVGSRVANQMVAAPFTNEPGQGFQGEQARSFWSALPRGLYDAYVEALTERSGEALAGAVGRVTGFVGQYSGATALLNRIGLPAATEALQTGIANRWARTLRIPGSSASAIEHGGYSGMLGELLEEKFGEVLRGPFLGPGSALDPANYGSIGMLASGDIGGFLRQTAIEGAAFGLYGGSGRIAQDLFRAGELPARGTPGFQTARQLAAVRFITAGQEPNEAVAERDQTAMRPFMDYFGLTPDNVYDAIPQPAPSQGLPPRQEPTGSVTEAPASPGPSTRVESTPTQAAPAFSQPAQATEPAPTSPATAPAAPQQARAAELPQAPTAPQTQPQAVQQAQAIENWALNQHQGFTNQDLIQRGYTSQQATDIISNLIQQRGSLIEDYSHGSAIYYPAEPAQQASQVTLPESLQVRAAQIERVSPGIQARVADIYNRYGTERAAEVLNVKEKNFAPALQAMSALTQQEIQAAGGDYEKAIEIRMRREADDAQRQATAAGRRVGLAPGRVQGSAREAVQRAVQTANVPQPQETRQAQAANPAAPTAPAAEVARRARPELLDRIRDIAPHGIRRDSLIGRGKIFATLSEYQQVLNPMNQSGQRKNIAQRERLITNNPLATNVDEVADALVRTGLLGDLTSMSAEAKLMLMLERYAGNDFREVAPDQAARLAEQQHFEEQHAERQDEARSESEAIGSVPIGSNYETPPGEMFFRGQPQALASGQKAPEKPVGPFEIIATAERLFQVPRYVTRMRAKAAAVFAVRPEAIKVRSIEAGNAPIFMHEVAHAIDTRGNIIPGPFEIPAEIMRGLRLLDYELNRKDQSVAAKEGFAEYVRLVTTGQFQQFVQDAPVELQPSVLAAGAWIEQRLPTDVREKLEVVRKMFDRFQGMPASQQAASLISTTGQEVLPNIAKREQLTAASQSLLQTVRDALINDLGPLMRAESEAQKRGRAFSIMPSVLIGKLRYMARPLMERMVSDGMVTVIKDSAGNMRFKIDGPALKDVTQNLQPADMAAGVDGSASRFSTFATARHVLAENAAGRPSVSGEQVEIYRRAMEDFKQDPEFAARATAAAEKLTSFFNASLRSLATAGFLDKAKVEEYIAARPTYVPLARVRSEIGAKTWFQRKGEKIGGPIKQRKGSGEQVVDVLATAVNRANTTAFLLAEQIKRMTLDDLFRSDELSAAERARGVERSTGLGAWMAEVDRPLVPHTVSMDQLAEAMKAAGMEQDAISDMLDTIPEVGLSYFSAAPFPMSGKAQFVVMREGKEVWYQVNDKPIYDLITGQQGKDSIFMPMLKGMSTFLRPFTQLVKFGATTLNPEFQIFNTIRDVATFMQNTTAPATVKDLPSFYARALSLSWSVATGKTPTNLVDQLYVQAGGSQLRMLDYDPLKPQKNIRIATGLEAPTRWQRGLQKTKMAFDLAGATEMAPRLLEFRNELARAGFREEELNAYVEAHPGEDPVDIATFIRAAAAAGNVTVDFSRIGYLSRAMNQVVPFLGPPIAGLTNFIQAVQQRPGRVGAVLLGLLGVSIAHFLKNKDEPWYRELEPHLRQRFWVWQAPWGSLLRFPKPQGPLAVAMGAFEEMLRLADAKNPDFAGWAQHSFDNVAPPIPIPAPLNVVWNIGTNRSWTGAPIVPERDKDLPGNLLRYQFPYAANQLTGGAAAMPRVPFMMRSTPNVSVDNFYGQFRDLEARRLSARRVGLAFEGEQDYKRMEQYGDLMRLASQSIRGGMLTRGRKQEERTPATQDERNQIEQFRIAVAQAALGQPHVAPFSNLGNLPQGLRVDIEEWMSQQAAAFTTATHAPLRQPGQSTADYQARRQERLDTVNRIEGVFRELGVDVGQARRLMQQHRARGRVMAPTGS